jgi:hypothetical protein
MSKQFWMVWNPDDYPPRVCHDTEAAAETEAERLARTNPGVKFYLLEATQMFEVNNLRRIDMRQSPGYRDELPF